MISVWQKNGRDRNVRLTKVAETAIISESSDLGDGVQVWHFAQLRENVSIGNSTIIGKNVYIGPGVTIGSNCKIQNDAKIYETARVENGVFIGPGVTFTNDRVPRAVNPDLTLKIATDWQVVGVHVSEGASIGAGSICIAPIKIGKWSMVGAGSVVTQDVPDYALVLGNPARQIGWVGKSGKRLRPINDNLYSCPDSHSTYTLIGRELIENSLK